jgi:hypothetical protein
LFDQILVTPHERQWAHSRDLLLVHPESQTDSFILYIKGTILMSRVKVFNHRFRALHYAGDPQYAGRPLANSRGNLDDPSPPETIDPRGSPAFLELENIVSSFRASFPSHLRTPITDNVVDSHLYTACLMPHAYVVYHFNILTVHLSAYPKPVRQSFFMIPMQTFDSRAVLQLSRS